MLSSVYRICILVAPLAGAWIETCCAALKSMLCCVAPLAGAWIETIEIIKELGEKYVAPLAGAWIETTGEETIVDVVRSRSPRGSVD